MTLETRIYNLKKELSSKEKALNDTKKAYQTAHQIRFAVKKLVN